MKLCSNLNINISWNYEILWYGKKCECSIKTNLYLRNKRANSTNSPATKKVNYSNLYNS